MSKSKEWPELPLSTVLSGGEEEGGRERALATALERPGVCSIVMENLDWKVSWHCWRADLGGERRRKAASNGL